MKQYLVTFHGSAKNWMEKSDEEWMALGRERAIWIEKLGDNYSSGKLASQSPVSMAMKNGKYEVHEIPFDENKETLNGFFVIDAKNMDHAVELMKGCPWFIHDRIEIFEAEL